MSNSLMHSQTIVPALGRSVSIDQAARLLNVSRRTVYNRIRVGRLRTLRTLGGSQRVLVDSLHDSGFSSGSCSPSNTELSLPVRSGTQN